VFLRSTVIKLYSLLHSFVNCPLSWPFEHCNNDSNR